MADDDSLVNVVCPPDLRHHSFESTVNAARATNRVSRALAFSQQLRGTEIVGGGFSDVSLSLYLPSEQVLHFTIFDGAIEWTLLPRSHSNVNAPQEPSHIFLQFDNLTSPFLWDRESIISNVKGRCIALIGASVSVAYIEFSGGGRLDLSRIIKVDDKKDLMFFFFE